MAKGNFSAHRFWLAHQFASTEETRYYLNGVYIEPGAEGGVVMVATDGHVMAIVNDPTGSIDAPAIVGLAAFKSALSACKPIGRHEPDSVRCALDGDALEVTERRKAGEEWRDEFLAKAAPVLIDGSFPDWRRVLPAADRSKGIMPDREAISSTLLGRIACALKPFGKGNPPLRFAGTREAGLPFWVMPVGLEAKFGSGVIFVAMPMRAAEASSLEWLERQRRYAGETFSA